MNHRRVVITGAGVASPIGHDREAVADALKCGRHGVRAMPEWSKVDELRTLIGAPITDLDLEKRFPRKKRRTLGRVGLLSAFATEEALHEAGLEGELLSSGRVGVAYGSTSGSSGSFETFCEAMYRGDSLSMRGLESTGFLKFMSHTCAANLAYLHGLRGRVIPTSSACTSGSQAIGFAYEAIKYGLQDVMICGGAEELHFTSAVTFDLMMATSIGFNDRPELSPRPFDARRDGLVIGEGAATLILESEEHARARGAEPLAEVAGFGTNCDGTHLTAPDASGMQGALELALADARIEPAEVDYVNGHGTATDLGDVAESQATRAVFGRDVPFSSTKGHVGHTLGAAGAVEAVFGLAMMERGFMAPTRNLEELDPRCASLGYLREPTDAAIRVFMSNNFAFGGINTSLLFRALEGA